MVSRGVVFVAYGRAAREQCVIALRCLYRVHPRWPVAVISDEPMPRGSGIPATAWIECEDVDPGARWAKLNMDLLSPWDWTVYFDADTRARYPMDAGWRFLEAGWEMLICPTAAQQDDLFRHIVQLSPELRGPPIEGTREKETTIAEVGGTPILALQGGAIWFRKTEAVHRFFAVWREEWKRWRNQDQAALMRALRRSPVKLWLLDRAWNGGALLGHYHTMARRAGLRGAVV